MTTGSYVVDEERRHQTYRDYSWLHRLISDAAWPRYECENCIGLEPEHSTACYCEYHGASAPGMGPTNWNLIWRWVWEHRA